MGLLFITQKIDEKDDDLAFVTQWVDEFIKNDFKVTVLCLEKGEFDDRFPVYSLGKEKGYGKIKRLFNLFRYSFTLKYDAVFVHMNPEYFTYVGWYWWLRRIPMYLWYTHYTMHIHLKLAGFYCKYMFAATKQSLPQYEGSVKKVITGHGVDVNYWSSPNRCESKYKLLMVHRLSRSKRVEIGIKALSLLPREYTLTIYGRPIDKDYYKELLDLVKKLKLEDRVFFKGPLPMPELRKIYPQYKIMINMAMETIDKTMLEAMCNGVYPITTPGNSVAIGLPKYPKGEAVKDVAEFIKKIECSDVDQKILTSIVNTNHSLSGLILNITKLIRDNKNFYEKR